LRDENTTFLRKAVRVVDRAAGYDYQHCKARPARELVHGAEAQRRQRRQRDQAPAQLVVGVEHQRRHHRDQQAADGPARGHGQVERGQVARRRTRAVELAMAEHAGDEQAREEHGDLDPRSNWKRESTSSQPMPHSQASSTAQKISTRYRRPFEGDDERQQVERERRQPEQRDRRDVLRHVVGHCQQQHRAGGREREPQQIVAARGRHIHLGISFFVGVFARKPRQADAQQREGGEQADHQIT
jgi:hypothetical protein